MFTLFLYPYISQGTLLKIKDDIVFPIIHTYLKHVCNTILDFTKSLDTLIYTANEDGYILKRLFIWPRDSRHLSSPESIPFYENDLRNYLKIAFDWGWIDHSKITANYKQNVIDIFKPKDPEEIIRLSINELDNKAILMVNGIKIDEFIITRHELCLSIDTKTTENKIDFFVRLMKNKCKDYVLSFLINLRSQVTPNLQSYEIISKDENFVKALEEMDKNIKI